MDGAVDASASQQGGVGGIHNRIDLKLRDVSQEELETGHGAPSLVFLATNTIFQRPQSNETDSLNSFSRAAGGRFIKDSPRPQVLFVVGDGDGPLNLHEW